MLKVVDKLDPGELSFCNPLNTFFVGKNSILWLKTISSRGVGTWKQLRTMLDACFLAEYVLREWLHWGTFVCGVTYVQHRLNAHCVQATGVGRCRILKGILCHSAPRILFLGDILDSQVISRIRLAFCHRITRPHFLVWHLSVLQSYSNLPF